jgi:uncharacterized protein (DUF433 family)
VAQKVDIYRGKNPVEVPTYSLAEAAHDLQLPRTTVVAWAIGRRCETKSGSYCFRPLIRIADRETPLLSFLNLAELHVLSAMRRDLHVKLRAVRQAIQYLSRAFRSEHPLVQRRMLTEGTDLFIERYGEYVTISQRGQLAMKQVLQAYLERLERNHAGTPIRLFPFTRTQIGNSPKTVAIDPRVQFGRPCLTGTGIPTAILLERYKAGDSIHLLAEDYGVPPSAIEEALRYEIPGAA